jgi:hypothetical protein
MSGVFQNIDPPPPHRPAGVYPSPPPPLVRGEDTLAGWRGGWGVNILEDARHSSVLFICKYFVCVSVPGGAYTQGGGEEAAHQLRDDLLHHVKHDVTHRPGSEKRRYLKIICEIYIDNDGFYSQ